MHVGRMGIKRKCVYIRATSGLLNCLKTNTEVWKYEDEKKTPDYGAISRRSIQNDFKRVQRYPEREKRPQIENLPEINAERRVLFVGENSGYYKLRSFIVGKLVRLVQKSSVGGWVCEFVHDDDRKAINHAAGWSDNKKQYLLDCVKFKWHENKIKNRI